MQGHWDAVMLAYGLTTATMCVYLGVLLARLRAAERPSRPGDSK